MILKIHCHGGQQASPSTLHYETLPNRTSYLRSSVAREQLFTGAMNICYEKRSSMKGEKTKKLLIWKKNLPLLKVDQ